MSDEEIVAENQLRERHDFYGLRVPRGCYPPNYSRPVLALAPTKWDGWQPVFYDHDNGRWYDYEGRHPSGCTPTKGVIAWMDAPIDHEKVERELAEW